MADLPESGAGARDAANPGSPEPPPWYTSRNPTRRWLHLGRSDWIKARLRESVAASGSPANRILEIGCGSGHYLAELSAVSEQAIATEIRLDRLPMLAEHSRELRNVSIVADDIRKTSLRAGSFDVVLCSEVIEHVSESLEALRAMRGLLRDGGRLLLTTPQRYSVVEVVAKAARCGFLRRIMSMVYREPIEALQHINLLTAGQLKRQLAAAGLTVLGQHSCGLYIPVLAECCGTPGQRIAAALEPMIARSWLRPLLWTQCYVLGPAPAGDGTDGSRRGGPSGKRARRP